MARSGAVDRDLDLAFGIGVDADGPRTAADATILDVNLLPGFLGRIDLQGAWLTAVGAEERCVQGRAK
jgi:hypothetical protein